MMWFADECTEDRDNVSRDQPCLAPMELSNNATRGDRLPLVSTTESRLAQEQVEQG
jgi:hypothetical protein